MLPTNKAINGAMFNLPNLDSDKIRHVGAELVTVKLVLICWRL